MTDAISPATGVSDGPRGPAKNSGGGQLRPMFPNSLKTWVDDELLAALELAATVEKERQAIIVRRWLRRAAIAEGYYRKGE
jgi:hypothetical protein